MNIHGRSLIAGKRSVSTTRTFAAMDPTNGATLEPLFQVATPEDVDAAVAAATLATGALADPDLRRRFLNSIAEELERRRDALVERATRETALPAARINGELGRTTGQLRLFAEVAAEGSWVDARLDTAEPNRQPIPKPDVRSMLVPLGPVAVFGASNFPLAFSVAGGDSASAWAAGNPVIVKAHASHPGTSELVGNAVMTAAQTLGLPGGVFSLLFDDAHEVGVALTRHPGIRAVGFTGSRGGGVALSQIAAARPRPIPVFAEMGSVNPLVILPGALHDNTETLAAQLFASCSMGVGQFCTTPGLVFVPVGDDGDAFVAHLGNLAQQAKLHAMLSVGSAAAYHKSSEDLHSRGVRLLGVGHSEAQVAAGSARVWETDLPTLTQHPGLQDEIFGPCTLVVRWSTFDALVTFLSTLEGQLTATVHASDDEVEHLAPLWQALAEHAGRLLFGGFPTGVEVGPAMVHGGPFPATTDASTTSVGTRAIRRFARLLALQNAPQLLLPPELRDGNPRRIWRMVDGAMSK